MSVSTEAELPVAGGEGQPSPLTLLFAPDRGMARQARVGRALWFFLFAWVCSILLGAALAYRIDARSSTLERLDKGGQLQTMSDRQIDDEVSSAERTFEVISIAKGVAAIPVQLGLTSFSLLALTWFLHGRIKGSAVAPVAAATLLPGGIGNLLDAVAAFRHAVISPEGVPLAPRSLGAIMPILGHPLTGPWLKLANAFDFFSLWSAVMLGFGLVAAGQVKKTTAVIGTLVAWTCYRLLTNVATGG